jgi:hypothetical protein
MYVCRRSIQAVQQVRLRKTLIETPNCSEVITDIVTKRSVFGCVSLALQVVLVRIHIYVGLCLHKGRSVKQLMVRALYQLYQSEEIIIFLTVLTLKFLLKAVMDFTGECTDKFRGRPNWGCPLDPWFEKLTTPSVSRLVTKYNFLSCLLTAKNALKCT